MVETTADCEISTIDQFTFIKPLGLGGQGQVVLAKNQKVKLAALKFFEEPTLKKLEDEWRKDYKDFP
jgi:hypothetical protein